MLLVEPKSQLSYAQQNVPNTLNAKYSLDFPSMARNLNKYAIPLITTYALCSIQGADAGILGFVVGYVGTTVVGGAMVVVGAITAPVGGAVLIGAGVATVTAAPYVGVAAGGLLGPI